MRVVFGNQVRGLIGVILFGSLCFTGCDGSEKPAVAAGPPVKDATPVAVEAVVVGVASSYHTATAVLEAESRAEMRARTTGVVRRLRCEEGQTVKAGDILLQLEDDDARVRVRQAELQHEKAQTELSRRESMRAAGVLSDEDFLVARNDFRQSEAALELARLELAYTVVTAPWDGVIVRRLVDLGGHVAPGTPLIEMMDVDPLLARIHVPAGRSAELAVGQTIELQLEGSGVALNGRIRLVSPIVDPETGTVKITAEIASYPAGTRPGDFCRARVVTARHENAILVINRAVIEERGEHVVFLSRDGKAHRQVVKPGFVDGDRTEILEGLDASMTVIVKGQRGLQDGDPIKVTDGELSAAEREPNALPAAG